MHPGTYQHILYYHNLPAPFADTVPLAVGLRGLGGLGGFGGVGGRVGEAKYMGKVGQTKHQLRAFSRVGP